MDWRPQRKADEHLLQFTQIPALLGRSRLAGRDIAISAYENVWWSYWKKVAADLIQTMSFTSSQINF